jgi:RNA polymerase sigma-70 factor (ECF subfamily)
MARDAAATGEIALAGLPDGRQVTARPDQPASEGALIVLARAGDDTAFGELVRRRQASVRGLLRRLTGDAALGDDLAQDTFVRAWRTLGQLREPGAFGGWIRQIAVHVWLQHARRARLPMDFVAGHELDLEEAAGTAARLADRLDIEAALARLRPPERLCIVLAYTEGMSHAEIAAAANLPLGTVKSHLARATARLRLWLRGALIHAPRSAS